MNCVTRVTRRDKREIHQSTSNSKAHVSESRGNQIEMFPWLLLRFGE